MSKIQSNLHLVAKELKKTIESSKTILTEEDYYNFLFKHVSCKKIKDLDKVNSLYHLRYGDYSILVFNDIVELSSTIPLEDEDVLKYANSVNANIVLVELPLIINPELISFTSIIDLAKKMGYFKHDKTIFDLIEDSPKTFINGLSTTYILDGDWVERMNEDYDYDTTIWTIDISKGGNLYEFYFSFNELCNAQLIDQSWFIEDTEISFFN